MSDPASFGTEAQRLSRLGDFAGAEAVLRDGLAAIPGHPVLGYALGILLLARGAYEEGWPLYEHRGAVPRGPKPPGFSFPRWRGEAVESLLVMPEQGFGDQIMFARYIPLLVARGVRVTLLTAPELARLFEPLGARVIPLAGTLSLERHDAWCFIGSLPGLLGGIPNAPYLPGAAGGSGTGVMTFVRDAHKALGPEAVAELQAMGRDLSPSATGARDFRNTAEIVDGLARVITVDTAVAHLAGAMGKPVWVLLPYGADWRWGRGRSDSEWYPSARLFRQPAYDDWASVVAQVKMALTAAEPPQA